VSRLNFLKDKYTEMDITKFSSREDLYVAIKKKSINTLLWICAINLGKLAFFALSGFFFNMNNQLNISSFPTSVLSIVDYALIILPIVFTLFWIYLIFRIRSKNTVETLLISIKNARNGLKLYLSLVLISYLIIIYITIYQTIVSGTNDETLNESWSYYTAIILACVVCTIVILLILWLLYKLLYSRFLKSLTKNYYTLKDMI